VTDWTEAPEWQSDGNDRTAERRAFARAARAARSIAGCTQAQAADAVGVARQTWSDYETATCLPRPGVLTRVSVWAGVEAGSLTDRSGALRLAERAAQAKRARRAAVRALIRRAVAERLISVEVGEAWDRSAGVGRRVCHG
jgi:transcriptional regulator with XRE-family HTH domain